MLGLHSLFPLKYKGQVTERDGFPWVGAVVTLTADVTVFWGVSPGTIQAQVA